MIKTINTACMLNAKLLQKQILRVFTIKIIFSIFNIYMRLWMLTKLIVVIHDVHKSKHSAVHFKLTQCYMSVVSQ